jgi:predicted double-glycine peptidase
MAFGKGSFREILAVAMVLTKQGESQVRDSELYLEVPFYRQRFDFTCGAASLMMAMKYFYPGLKLTKSLEIDIWRETNLVEDRSTCGRGLAYSAAKRGFGARIVASVDDIPFKEKILKISPGADPRVLDFFFRDMQKRALALDVKEERGKVTIEEIFSALERGEVPIVLINAMFLHREDVPHWVVVRGYNRREVFIHDPLWKAHRRGGVAVQKFKKMIGYGAGQVMIALSARFGKR